LADKTNEEASSKRGPKKKHFENQGRKRGIERIAKIYATHAETRENLFLLLALQ